jgi:phospholipid/cholesterol/gamma-HCH transport system substrate-binding protein
MRWSLVPRIVALLLVVFGGFYYIAVDVLGYNLGPRPYTVTVMLPRAGGLYAEGDVTYRGVPVGQVSHLVLTQTGVQAKLEIKHGTQIPAQTTANIRQLSAIGEQYIDLVPTSSTGPYLHNGSVIPASATTEPLPIGQVLSDSGALVSGINTNDIATLEKILTSGFSNTAPDLRRIIVTGQSFARALIGAQAGTVELVNDGNTVLHTALATNQQFAHFTAAIAQLSGTFRKSNADVRSILLNGSAAANGVDSVLKSDSAAIEGFVSGVGKAGTVSLQYQEAVHAVFQMLPIVAGDLSSLGANGLQGELGINTDEPICGYGPTGHAVQPAVPTQALSGAALDNTCQSSASNMLQRGAQTSPVVPVP